MAPMTTDSRSGFGRAASAIALFTTFASAGCAAGDGTAWGVWYPELSTVHDAATRETDDGAVRTVLQYHVSVDELSLELAEVQLLGAAEGASAGFDPASPPEGYSLCHAGHCHADDGTLVDYADIEQELLGGSSGGAVASSVVDASAPLDTTPTVVPGGSCADGCMLERGALASVAVRVVRADLRLTVTDPEVGRLGEPVEFVASVPLDATVAAALSARVGDAAPHLYTALTLTLAPTWLDDLRFDALDATDADALLTQLSAAMTDSLTLVADLDRRDSRSGEGP